MKERKNLITDYPWQKVLTQSIDSVKHQQKSLSGKDMKESYLENKIQFSSQMD
jgi:hypothetical protein